MPAFRLLIEHAHHTPGEFDERPASPDEVLDAYDRFDWLGEVRRAEDLQRVSPTNSVQSPDDRLIWVSAVGTPKGLEFVSEYAYLGIIKFFFGLWKGPGRVAVDRQSFTPVEARRALELFLADEHESLLQLYRGAAL